MDKGTVIRIVVFLFAWLNQYLVSKGIDTLPVVDETMVAGAITFGASIWALVRHNVFTKKAAEKKAALKNKE